MSLSISPRAFRRLTRKEKIESLVSDGLLARSEADDLLQDIPILPLSVAEHMIENVIGVFGTPIGLVPGVVINNRTYDVPMVIEEPSVVAAQANAAKMVRAGGGYEAGSTDPVMVAQIQVLDMPDVAAAQQRVIEEKMRILATAEETVGGLVRRGGGPRDVTARRLRHPDDEADMLVVHLHIDTRDAMGANAVNTAAEHCAPLIEDLTGGRVVLRILSNLTDLRRAWARARIPISVLDVGDQDGREVAQGIVEASRLAEVDPYRAATHNKGAMNGVDAVVVATGNDYRAVEAGAHAYAAREGRYAALSTWRIDDDHLLGEIRLPLALGVVGGQIRSHPWVPKLLRILNVESARELSEVVAAVGLGQNLAALRALASEGIQAGHMAMHARAVALDVGARSDEVEVVVRTMRERGDIGRTAAAEILAQVRAEKEA